MLSVSLQATHNRAGEITYRWLGGLQYEATITTYTRNCTNCADRCSLRLNWGDGSSDELIRSNGPNRLCPGGGAGEVISNGIKKNIYRGTHTYASSGSYTLWFEDPNRNGGVTNIPNSIEVPFYVQSELTILPGLGPNSSPVLTNPPVEEGCTDRRFEHSAGAYDPDGDSLGYRLVLSRTTGGDEITTIYDPQYVRDSVEINSNGQLIWDVPQQVGQFNFAFQIIEYRKNSRGQWVRMGSVTRDMQVDIDACPNQPPEVQPIGPFCVEAGETLDFLVTATDRKDTIDDYISLSAFGGPFAVTNPADPFFNTSKDPVIERFRWETECNHIREQPYKVTFKAQDSLDEPGFDRLSDLYTTDITVIGPAPQNPSATANENSIALNWSRPRCSNAVGYKIYRRETEYGFIPGECETGVPAYTGYERIATRNGGSNTSYVDSADLKRGVRYCYMVVATYPPDVDGYASIEFCASLPLIMPLMTKVDVLSTDEQSGDIDIAWIAPPELDSNSFPPPYGYDIYRAEGIDGQDYERLQRVSGLNNTTFSDQGLNTQDNGYRYMVAFLSGPNQDSVGSSDPASSVYLTATGRDEKNELQFKHNTPWLNEQYTIFRENPTGSGNFDSIAQAFEDSYVDTGLVNGQTYCYRVRSSGRYTANDSLPSPLLNNSQEACGMPIDTVAPCPPDFSSEFFCEMDSLVLRWSNGNDPDCVDRDIQYYNLYYKEDPTDNFGSEPIVENITDTVFTIALIQNSGLPLNGCYAVNAVDDADNDGGPNIGALSETICLELCPLIEFPNVFTPNGDNFNEFFKPINFRDLGEVQFSIYNRWGGKVYETNSREELIQTGWNGVDQTTGMEAPEGVYYYVFTFIPRNINEERRQKRTGFFHLLR